MNLEEKILSKLMDKKFHKSKEFNIDSSLVRKAIRKLRMRGYPIKGTNDGYILVDIKDIDEELITYRNRALKILEVYNTLKRMQKNYFNKKLLEELNLGGNNNETL